MKKRVLYAVLLSTILGIAVGFGLSGVTTKREAVSASPEYATKQNNAANYLLRMYNEALGLVANSEDKGNYTSTDFPPEQELLPCNSTYWVYSDNLWAGWALRLFNRTIAENITKTVQRYVSTFGRSMLFEAAIGEAVPTTIQSKKDLVALQETINGVQVQVLLDRHQYGDSSNEPFRDAEEYADLCFYMTINYWMMNDTRASEHWFRTGENLWNNITKIGFYDKGIWNSTDHLYSNFKLGLFLLAQKVTGFSSAIVGEVEARLWNCNNTLGGIVTLSYPDGSPYGTANTETTAAALLSYNNELVSHLHQRKSLVEEDLRDQLVVAGNRITDLEGQIIDAETKIQSLSLDIRNITIVSLVSSASLIAVTLILGVKFVRLRRTMMGQGRP